MRLNLNIEKSIERERIIPKSRLKYYSDFLLFGYISIAFLVVIIGMLYELNFRPDTTLIFWISVYLLIFPFVFYQLFNMDKFVHIENKNNAIKSETLRYIVKDNKWNIVKQKDDLLIAQTNPRYLHNRQVTFLKCDGYLLVNVMSFGKYDWKSPIYYRSDKVILSRIIDELMKQQNNAT